MIQTWVRKAGYNGPAGGFAVGLSTQTLRQRHTPGGAERLIRKIRGNKRGRIWAEQKSGSGK